MEKKMCARMMPYSERMVHRIMSSVIVNVGCNHLTFYSLDGSQYDGFSLSLLENWLQCNPNHYRIKDRYFSQGLFMDVVHIKKKSVAAEWVENYDGGNWYSIMTRSHDYELSVHLTHMEVVHFNTVLSHTNTQRDSMKSLIVDSDDDEFYSI